MATYTVKSGDCLWNIAQSKLGNPYRWTEIADLNGISRSNPIIHPGDVLTLPGSSSGGTTINSNKNTSNKARIEYLGLQAGTDRTLYATWSWSRTSTKSYKVYWYYSTGNNIWFTGATNNNEVDSNHPSDSRQSTYTAPSNAYKVKLIVRPIAKTGKVNNKETSKWTAGDSTAKYYSFSNAPNPPGTPSAPDVNISNLKLTAILDDVDSNTTKMMFEVIKDNNKVFNTSGKLSVKTNHVEYSCSIKAGSVYKVRCRGCNKNDSSEWGPYSSNKETIPAVPTEFETCKANSETSVYLEWGAVSTATSYDIEYTTEKRYFDGSDGTNTITGITTTQYEKTGLESGDEYFFRIRAVNSSGESGWSEIKSVIVGEKPAAPTTWSSTTTAITGETLNLYWVHNSVDGSSQTYAELELTINGTVTTETIKNTEDEDKKDKTSIYTIDTTPLTEGSQITWRVRTAGVTLQYGDWSIVRTVDVYAPPTLEINLYNSEGNAFEQLTSFPFYLETNAGPATQNPIGYYVSIIANEAYETTDNIGNVKMVSSGEEVYSRYFDFDSSTGSRSIAVTFSANNVNLDNNISYTASCTVSMDSGLTASASKEFTVAWTDIEYSPNAEIGVDLDTVTAQIRPYCEDDDGTPISGVTLSVYRREFDGGFTEIASGVENTGTSFVVDPHPSLDYARYRIVATTVETGAVSFYDVPGYPIGKPAVIIQWSEAWQGFETTNSDEISEPTWSGSMLVLPYNIDISSTYRNDVTLVKYTGRSHPVSYYGTQRGETASWSMEIPKNDTETLYGIRRLSVWPGDVYVREPSGSGYWANINVTFNQDHLATTIPITFEITRVEGGI